ncbi:MAG: hypothetical protein QOK63_09770 [Nitrososphaeraceae archaeon]|nr:hypothetical protein [Nitrososphaeraceae archaeon]MDW0187753.1 hypothetical protein [Nitrososphaeraceae archaeon]
MTRFVFKFEKTLPDSGINKTLISIHIQDVYEYRRIRLVDPKSHNTVKKLIRGNHNTIVEAILVKSPNLRVNPN